MTPRESGPDGRRTIWVGAFACVGYAYLGVLIGLLGTATYFLARSGYFGAAFMTSGVVLYLLSALRVHLPPPQGRVIQSDEAPQLFRLLEEVRQALDAPVVHHVVLTHEANASVVDLPRHGIFGSRRFLAIGVPLLAALSVDELRALIAHELAHLARHGRMRLWVGRVQTTWSALAMSAQWSGSWLGVLLVPFFRWYAPRLAVAVESASRGDELEADRLAAAHAGVGAVVRTLARVGIVNAYLQDESLPLLFQQSAEHDEPPVEAFDRALRRVPGRDWAHELRWLETLLGDRSLDTDSHPSLTDRLAALGKLHPDARLLARDLDTHTGSGALALLGPSTDELIGGVARGWAEEANAVWKRLVADVEIWRSPRVEEDEEHWVPWARARWAALCEPPDSAIERLGAILVSRDDPEARFLLGGALIRRPTLAARARGRTLLESVMAEESHFALGAAELLQRDYVREGREGEAERCKMREAALRAAFLRSLRERGHLAPGDTLRAFPLPSVTARRLEAELRLHEGIGRAFLVQKLTRHMSASPLVILAIEAYVPWYRPDFGNAQRTLAETLAERVLLPQTVDLVVIPVPPRSRLTRRLARLQGALIYARDSAISTGSASPDLAWNRAPLLARLAVGTPFLVLGLGGLALAAGFLAEWSATPPAEPGTLPELRRAVDRAPEDAGARLALGEALFFSGERAEARTVLSEAVRLDPDNPAANYYLGVVLLTLGRSDDAESPLRRATELEPLNAAAPSALAMALNNLGRAREGEPLVRRSLALDDQDPYAHAVLGTILKNLGRAAEALSSFERVAELAPDDPRAWLEIGVLEHLVGDYPASVRALERAQTLDPTLFERLDFERAILQASRDGRPYG